LSYKPTAQSKYILDRAWDWIQSVPYQPSARWVFYRLLQDGTYDTKAGYRHLLGLLSNARKEFYQGWNPGTLADDTRAPVLMERVGFYTVSLRGWGFKNEAEWLETVKKELNCPLDRWTTQPVYEEIWFEAAAMQGQFIYYANPNVPLLAFHGDVSIPEKWRTAKRLAERWLRLRKPIRIFYYGDLDPKGLVIPESAWEDISKWTFWLIQAKEPSLQPKDKDDERGLKEWIEFRWSSFIRVGITKEQVQQFKIPENPERPGTYQWEALDDKQAKTLIDEANEPLDLDAFADFERQEKEIAKQFRKQFER